MTAPLRPLDGITVIEAATYISGPFAGLMLADLGAEVVKVEPPTGDPGRRFGLTHKGTSALGHNVNRSKRVEAIDLKAAAGHQRLLELVAGADVFLHNWRPGVAAKLGLAAEQLCGRWPRLVYVSISGFGPDGPRAAGPVFDSLLQAASGLARYDAADGVPRLSRTYLADKVTATYAAQAVLAGLVSRSRTGRGGHHEVSMLDAMAYFNFPDMAQHRTFVDHQPDVAEARTPILATADGWIALAPVSGAQLSATVRALGHPEWIDVLKASERRSVIDRLFELAAPIVAGLPTRRCEEIFTAADVPVMPFLSVDEHLHDPQTVHAGLYTVGDSPAGPARQIRHPDVVDGHHLGPAGDA